MGEVKESSINPKNNDDNFFQYVIIVTINHENISKHPERIVKTRQSKN